MKKKVSTMLEYWIDHIGYFRVIFFVALLLTVFLNSFYSSFALFQSAYLALCLLLGFAYWNNKWIRFIFVGLIVASRLLFDRIDIDETAYAAVLRYANLWITYTLVTFSISFVVRFYLKQKQNILQLTFAMAKALDSRDHYTANHSENVAYYARKIAEEMKLPKAVREQIHTGGLLHDIGKIGVPETILKKSARLTNEEYNIIKQHPVIGFDMVKHISDFQRNGILDMILYHHERYDGNGYPSRLSNVQIPLTARIMAVADSFDAMTSKRVYRGVLDSEYAIEEIRKNAGTQFDPEVVNAFLRIWQREGNQMIPVHESPHKVDARIANHV